MAHAPANVHGGRQQNEQGQDSVWYEPLEAQADEALAETLQARFAVCKPTGATATWQVQAASGRSLE